MASWQDKIPTFNPYVQQMPVEAMATVGIEKQRRYDEGVQKIQSQIDSVAGLPILRDVDKQHLQTKLNQLGDKLRIVGAGDFSNYQLVNSTSGMVNTIAKDPIVLAAVQSTAWDSQQIAEMMEANKKGTGNPANDFNYQKQRNEYMEAGLTDDNGKPLVFSSPYRPYFDVDKFTRETFDAVKPDGFTYDQIYATDENGDKIIDKRVNPKTGKIEESYRLSMIMSRLKQEGRFPAKVQETLEHIMADPRVNQQLQISGEYNYQNLTPEDLAEKLNDTKQRELSMYEEQIRMLSLKKAIAPNQVERDKIDTEIDKINISKERVATNFEELSKLSITNPDGLRGMLYKDEARNNYRAMYTTMNEERTILANPAFQATLELQKIANTLAMHREEMDYKNRALAQSDDHFRMDLNYKIGKEVKGKLGNAPTTGATPSNLEINKRFEENNKRSAARYDSAIDKLITLTGGIAAKRITDYMNANPGKTREEAVTVVLADAARTEGYKDVAEFKAALVHKAMEVLGADSTNMEDHPELRDAIMEARDAARSFTADMERKKKVDAIVPEIATEPPVTPEVMKLVEDANRATAAFSKQSEKELRDNSYQKLRDMGYSDKTIKLMKLNEDWFGKSIARRMQPLYTWNPKDQIEHEAALEIRAKAIQDNYMLNPTLKKTIITGDSDTDKASMAQVSTLIGYYKDHIQNESGDLVDNAAKMSAITTGKEKGSVAIETIKNEVDGNIDTKLIVYDVDSNNVGEIIITAEEANSIGMDVYSWYKSERALELEEIMLATNNNSTSYGPLDSPSSYTGLNRAWDRTDENSKLRNLRGNVDVAGHVKKGTKNGRVIHYPYLYIKHPDGPPIIIELNPVNDPDEALQKFNGLTPEVIEKFIVEDLSNFQKTE